MMNIAGVLPPLHSGAALRQGDLLFAQASQNINQFGNNQQQHQQYDSLISQKGQVDFANQNQHPINLLTHNQRQNVNQTLHFTEQKQGNHDLLSDRFTSADKNQRILLTGGMNSARDTAGQRTGLINENEIENIQPNRLNLAQARLPQPQQSLKGSLQQQMQHNRSFQSLDQPLLQQQHQNLNNHHSDNINVQANQDLNSHNTSIQLPFSRPPLGVINQRQEQNNGSQQHQQFQRNINSFKRPLSVRSGSMQNLGARNGYECDSLDGGSQAGDNEYDDKEQYPIRNSLKQRLNQVKNVFSAIRKNLEDQTESKIEENCL